MLSTEKTRLAALVRGLPPHAEALECEDLRGSRSLFGDTVSLPKLLRAGKEHGERTRQSHDLEDMRAGGLILWEDSGGVTPVAAARRILASRQSLRTADSGFSAGLEVPASTYIAGRCTSSFDLAWRLLEEDLLPEWGAVLCSCQTEGRGQLRRTWHSPRGNLHVSFRLPRDPNLRGNAASLVVGGLLVRALGMLGFSLSLKWPNDLLLEENGKAGGVLLEEREGEMLAGLGLNLAECPSASLLRADKASPAAVLLPHHARLPLLGGGGRDMKAYGFAYGEFLAPFTLWRHLVSAAILEYSHSITGQSLSRVLARCDRLLAWKGRWVTLAEADGSSFSGCCQGLGETGGLRLLSADGCFHDFFSGSLSLAAMPSVDTPECF